MIPLPPVSYAMAVTRANYHHRATPFYKKLILKIVGGQVSAKR